MSLRDYYRCKKCDAKVVYGPDRSDEDWEPFLLCRQCIAQLERTNAALLGALKEIDRSWTSDGWTPENAKARTVFTDDTIERWKRMRAAIAEAETTGGPNHEAHP